VVEGEAGKALRGLLDPAIDGVRSHHS
jgi:hypothetical protein